MVQINDDKSKVYEGILANADIVGSTMGPYGRNVTVDLGHGMATFKDGVSVSKLMRFEDPWARMGSHIVVSGCRRTVELAGDGTTATAVLIRELCKMDYSEDHIRTMVEILTEKIRKVAIPIMDGDKIFEDKLYQVARISANGREDIAKIITDVRMKIGKYGSVMVEHGDRLESEVVAGYAYKGGVPAHQFVNIGNRLELKQCRVVLINQEVSKLADINPILARNLKRIEKKNLVKLDPNALPEHKIPLVIITNMSGGALSSLAGNIQRLRAGENVPEVYVVSLPEFGEKRHEMMDDMAAIFDTRVFNHMRGVEIQDFKDADFGTGHIEAKGGRVFCFGHSGERLDAHIEYVKSINNTQRLALLTGGIGIIRIGGETEMEITNNQEIIDDTVRSVASAMEEGVVPGGGRMLETLAAEYGDWLRGPKEQIWANAGVKCPKETCELWKGKVIHGSEVNLWDEGIIDPAKVVIASITSAASASIQFLTTKYFLKYDAK